MSYNRKKAVLVQPELWVDPYELLPWRCQITQLKPKFKAVMSHPYMIPVYAQCWSATGESETLLKAYSCVILDEKTSRNKFPDEEGVTVKSTPRKLLESLQAWAPSGQENCCFIGKVKYFNEVDARAKVGEAFGGQFPLKTFSPRQMAELLLIKRNAFEHENEIRLIYIETQETSPPDRKEWTVAPNEIFDSVMFDPRLSGIELKEREESIRTLGYEGAFVTSRLYSVPLLMVWID